MATELTRPEQRFVELQAVVRERLSRNLRLRRTLPGGGRLRIDRQLPFLCLYRRPVARNDPGTQELVTTEAAYLFASGDDRYREGVNLLCRAVSEALREHFGILLFLELWAEPVESGTSAQPAFRIVTAEASSVPSMMEVFQSALQQIRIGGRRAEVSVSTAGDVAPPDLLPLDEACPGGSSHCVFMGLGVRPIYRDPRSGVLFPLVLQDLRRQLSVALRQAIFAFTGSKARGPHLHFDSLGPSVLVRAVRLVDQQLCDVSESFDFLLQATPVNSAQAWRSFADSHYRKTLALEYRPLPYHPGLLKRQLFEAPIERVEDPVVAHLLYQKQQELDRQLSTLGELNTPGFLLGSLQLYGEPDEELVAAAGQIVARTAGGGAQPERQVPRADAASIARRARAEIDFYRARNAAFNARVEVCNDIASGLMVSRDRLLISESFHAAQSQVEPLLHHEVGTHLLTYFNGRAQPLRQLYAGLAGYEGLQEGLATLAEHVSGGLTRRRLRTLAARVLAARAMVDRATFQETFDLLHRQHGIAATTAFQVTLRVFRGGGLTKDVSYLRGLRDVLQYLALGHDLEPLYVGKIALEHVPYVQELRRRHIIQPPLLLPRFWHEGGFRDRLEDCRGRTLLDLLETAP